MKIQQLLSTIGVFVTNEENRFIQRLGENVKIPSLDQHDQWIAQNLVRKGVYTISKDKGYIVKCKDEKTTNTKDIS